MIHVLWVSADGLTSVSSVPHLHPPMRLVRPLPPKRSLFDADPRESLQIEEREYEYSGRSNKISGTTIHEYVEVRR